MFMLFFYSLNEVKFLILFGVSGSVESGVKLTISSISTVNHEKFSGTFPLDSCPYSIYEESEACRN